jgi:hypothetical protein
VLVLVLVLVLEIGILWGTRGEYNDEGGSCRAVSSGFHIVSQKVTGVRNGDRGSGLRAYSIGIAIFQFFFRIPKSEFVSLCLLYPIRAGELNFSRGDYGKGD